MLTSSAFQTTMPLRPAGLPFELTTPKFCWAGSALHGEGGARLGAVHDDGAPVHPSQVDVRFRDEHRTEVTVVDGGGGFVSSSVSW